MTAHARRLPFLLLIAAIPSLALAYGVRVHALLPGRVLAAGRGIAGATVSAEVLPGTSDADLDAFRRWLWDRSSRLPDTAVRGAFLRRYPTASAFDARAMRELLMMNGTARVLGVDSFAAVYRVMTPHDRGQDPGPDYAAGRPIPLRIALEMGSVYPDLDRRNQSRMLRDARGELRVTVSGDTVPFDPMILNMGTLTGLSSQAHAHGGLNRNPKSDDPETLKKEPWNFAIATGFPGPVETYAPDNAQLYTDLSLLAALDGRPAWRALSAFFAGSSMHYTADVGNAVHTVQVGIHPIFVDATVQSWIRRSLTLFGLFGTAPTRNQIGIDIITNLHTFSEQLFEAELLEAIHAQQTGHGDSVPVSMINALRALDLGDDSLSLMIADTLALLHNNEAIPDFGRCIANQVIDANMRDGAEVYRVTRDIIDTRLRIGRLAIDFDTVPDDRLWRYLRVHRGAMIHTGLDDFNAVHARGVARTTAALRAWWGQYTAALSLPATQRAEVINPVLSRLIAERLRYLEAAERRRQAWIAQHGGALR